ncbi:hypothetical protein D8Y22_06225 [Salinadaptatus halalkaliphilus]|uniref:Uncharacterized protein n=1 Tax=Salinadaptatus halalkaliphilus TaxID=2419781 RepID=A0A4S3TQ03_9EURY|nr:hypothetical protein [Salinadaptatus halalkaliphilus]THE65760.1 hypothetical protein D8Y22_06225 [Salinadaptatus halalkaliphilus]
MVGTTLGDIRQYIESLSSESGRYRLVCARTGDRPVPASGLEFESRGAARAAAQATEQYRATLRQYDPQVPYYEIVVSQCPSGPTPTDDDGSSTAATPLQTTSVVEFCHTVAGVVFETIADSAHDDLEDAIMATYFDAAERIEATDELCLCLLESMASELEARLDPDEQADLLLASTQRLPSDRLLSDPLESTLAHLQSVALLEAYTLHSRPTDANAEARSWTVTLTDYALEGPDDRVVTLPLVLELFRQSPTRALDIGATEHHSSGSESVWELTVTTEPTDRPSGLVTVAPASHR